MTLSDTVWLAEPCRFRTTMVYKPVSAGQASEMSTLLCVSLLLTDTLWTAFTTWWNGYIWNPQIPEVQIRWTTNKITHYILLIYIYIPCPCCKSSSRPPGHSGSWTHSVVGPAVLPEPPPALVGLQTALVVLRRLLIGHQHPHSAVKQMFHPLGWPSSPFSTEAFAWSWSRLVSMGRCNRRQI